MTLMFGTGAPPLYNKASIYKLVYYIWGGGSDHLLFIIYNILILVVLIFIFIILIAST